MAEEPRKRTTDERIDAIAMNLELLRHQIQDMATTTKSDFQLMKSNFEIVLDSIRGLENIARAHSHMLDDHDDRIEDLEDGK